MANKGVGDLVTTITLPCKPVLRKKPKVAGYILDHNAQYITGCQDPEAHVWMQKLSELLNKGEITDKAAAVKWVREQKHEKTLDVN